MTDMPRFWMNEQTGVLRPAVEAYVTGGPMSVEQIAAMRAYLRQFIAATCWVGPRVGELRGMIDGLTSRKAITVWLVIAIAEGIDPL